MRLVYIGDFNINGNQMYVAIKMFTFFQWMLQVMLGNYSSTLVTTHCGIISLNFSSYPWNGIFTAVTFLSSNIKTNFGPKFFGRKSNSNMADVFVEILMFDNKLIIGLWTSMWRRFNSRVRIRNNGKLFD